MSKVHFSFWLNVLLAYEIVCTTQDSSINNQIFYQVSKVNLGIVPIGKGFQSISLMLCASECLKLSPTCESFIYDPVMKICLLGGVLGSAGTKPQSRQLIYSIWTEYCDTSLGYSMDIMRMHGVCLFISPTTATYSNAGKACKALSGMLVTVKTIQRKNIIVNVTTNRSELYYWVGLDDIKTEGVYIWSDGTRATSAEITIAFAAGQPDNYGNYEDCAEFASGHLAIYDRLCTLTFSYICEYLQ